VKKKKISNPWMEAAAESPANIPKLARSRSSRQGWPRPNGLDFNPDSAISAIDRAEFNQDYSLLIEHLENGTACKEELFAAAQVLRGDITRGRGNPGRHDTYTRYQEIADFVNDKGGKVDPAVNAASRKFKLSKKQIYEILREVKAFDEYLRSEQEHDDRMSERDTNPKSDLG
jgi:hypothetical protein